MLDINVLDQHVYSRFRRTSSFWYPVRLNCRYFSDIGIKFHFFASLDEAIADCDVLFLSSRYFHVEGKPWDDRQRILETLSSLHAKVGTVIWLDLRDSSGNTQFEVVPYVSKYLKKQLLKERQKYRQNLYGNRIYTDYFHREFGISDPYSEDCAPLPEGGEGKLGVSWNIGMHDNRGGGVLEKLAYFLSDEVEVYSGGEHRIPWGSCRRKRDVNMVALFHTDYIYDKYVCNTVAFQRRRAAEILDGLQDPDIITGKRIQRRQYLNLIARAKIVLSLFGWGEICFRDFEAFIAGAALLMPDLSHLETWPALYVSHETYWPLNWDLSDLEESYRYLADHESVRFRLARSGQDRYRSVWSQEGRQQFCDRLKGIIVDVLGGP